MNHLDEGTIHAWLDGALDAEQSRAIESHVQSCRQCADAVAEARGLVAASSRILGALDDVPAKVIPAQPASRRRPMWRAAPWVTGIAAVLLATVLLRNEEPVPSAPTRAVASAPVPERVTDSQQLAAPPTISAAPPTATISAPVGRVAAAPSAGAGAATVAPRPSAPTAPAVVGNVAGATGLQDQPLGAQKAEQGFAAEAERASRRSADLALESRERRDASASRAAAEQMQASAAPPPVPQSQANCYALPAPVESMTSQFAAPARQDATQRMRAGKAADAVVTAERARVTIVRLDTLRTSGGFVVRMASGDSSIGWWSRVAGDTVRVELVGRGITQVTAAQRVTCPPRE